MPGLQRIALAVGVEVLRSRSTSVRKASGPAERSRPARPPERVFGLGDSVASALTCATLPSTMPYFWKVKAASLIFAGCVGAHEADVVVGDPDLGAQLLALGHDGHHDGAGRDHGARRMGREVLDDAGLRRAQLEQAVAMLLLGELLAQPLRLRRGLGPLGLQLATVVGADLSQALLRLRDRRACGMRW